MRTMYPFTHPWDGGKEERCDEVSSGLVTFKGQSIQRFFLESYQKRPSSLYPSPRDTGKGEKERERSLP